MKILLIVLLCVVFFPHRTYSFPEVQLIKENRSSHSLSSSNTWREYPDLKVTFSLDESKMVAIGYVITIGSSTESHLVTRLIVDGSEVLHYRAISGNTIYHTNAVSGFVSLGSGRHEVRVDYRTPGSFSMSGTEDWTTASLQVTY